MSVAIGKSMEEAVSDFGTWLTQEADRGLTAVSNGDLRSAIADVCIAVGVDGDGLPTALSQLLQEARYGRKNRASGVNYQPSDKFFISDLLRHVALAEEELTLA